MEMLFVRGDGVILVSFWPVLAQLTSDLADAVSAL